MSSTPGHIKGSGPHRSTSIGTARSDDALIGRKAGISTHVNNDYLTGFAHYQSRWARIRQTIREPAAEMLGTMMLTLVGNATNCQVVLSSNSGVASSQKGDYLSLSFGWACSVSLGAWIAGGVSGGHVNPVVTLCLAVFRGFPWKKVPGYVIGQLIGAWLGALLVFGNYLNAIAIVEGGKGKLSLKTGELFGSYALDYMSAPNCFFDEFLGTFVLLLVVFAITDKNNGPPPPGLVPLVVFIAILGIAVGFGMQTGMLSSPFAVSL
ncbi:aquaporin-like protein [Lactifluus volemus]|nr:aquaporin-like protein [Lactifluus volemus]